MKEHKSNPAHVEIYYAHKVTQAISNLFGF